MKLDRYVDNEITRRIQLAEDIENGKHISGTKLTASSLGSPLQWQVLKHFGVKKAAPDPYTIRKFIRGRQVEDWFVGLMPDVLSKQERVEYRGTVGNYDAFVDTKNWDFPCGKIPVEVKSVTNAKFRRISTQKSSDRGHMLQAALYAAALGCANYAVAYVASDDYRVRVHIHSLADIKPEMDAIISAYETQVALGTVPVFVPVESWHSNPTYNPYAEWCELTQAEINKKLKKEYGL